MSNVEQLRQEVEALIKRYSTASQKQSELKGQLDAKKQELVELKREIEAAGFDPKNLKADRDRLEAELMNEIASFEKDLVEAEKAFEAYDK